jgi:hypothetical protein
VVSSLQASQPKCDEDTTHMLLKCSETRKRWEKFLSRKWLMFNEWTAKKKIINCTNILELRNFRNLPI